MPRFWFSVPFLYLSAFFRSRHSMGLQLVLCRHQVALLSRPRKRPRLDFMDRGLWVLASSLFTRWKEVSLIFSPATILKWHKIFLRRLWRWKSRNPGRPRISLHLRELIKRMRRENVTWGALRIWEELGFLGLHRLVALSTLKTYLKCFGPRRSPPGPSPRWSTFLLNHAKQIVACDFFTVHTIFGGILYAFVLLSHDRRKIVHVNVTEHPTEEWAARQITEAFPFDTAPKYLLHDRDSIFGAGFRRRVKNCGIREIRTSFRSPKQNAFCERVIGTLRRECTDHFLILNEDHLRSILKEFAAYYNGKRPHQSLKGRPPVNRRKIQSAVQGREVIALPVLDGLHHVYKLAA